MSDDSEGTPTRDLGRRRQTTLRPQATIKPASTTYSFTRRAGVAAEAGQLSVVLVPNGVELRAHGQALSVSKPEARRLLAGLLELLG